MTEMEDFKHCNGPNHVMQFQMVLACLIVWLNTVFILNVAVAYWETVMLCKD